MPRIYADNAATTKISQTAMKAMISAMENSYGNPSSIHQIGMAANDALQTAREQIARCLGCMPKEIFFTSGGTESDNQAIMSAAMLGAKQNKRHIISTAFEHHAVLHTLRRLKEQGFEIQLLDVGAEGNITAAQVEEAIRPDTCLVTVMFANNEIGSVLPMASRACRASTAPRTNFCAGCAKRPPKPGRSWCWTKSSRDTAARGGSSPIRRRASVPTSSPRRRAWPTDSRSAAC